MAYLLIIITVITLLLWNYLKIRKRKKALITKIDEMIQFIINLIDKKPFLGNGELSTWVIQEYNTINHQLNENLRSLLDNKKLLKQQPFNQFSKVEELYFESTFHHLNNQSKLLSEQIDTLPQLVEQYKTDAPQKVDECLQKISTLKEMVKQHINNGFQFNNFLSIVQGIEDSVLKFQKKLINPRPDDYKMIVDETSKLEKELDVINTNIENTLSLYNTIVTNSASYLQTIQNLSGEKFTLANNQVEELKSFTPSSVWQRFDDEMKAVQSLLVNAKTDIEAAQQKNEQQQFADASTHWENGTTCKRTISLLYDRIESALGNQQYAKEHIKDTKADAKKVLNEARNACNHSDISSYTHNRLKEVTQLYDEIQDIDHTHLDWHGLILKFENIVIQCNGVIRNANEDNQSSVAKDNI